MRRGWVLGRLHIPSKGMGFLAVLEGHRFYVKENGIPD